MLEDLTPTGRNAVATGDGRRLGRAMAKALAKAGADVLAAARTRTQVGDTVAGIRADGGHPGVSSVLGERGLPNCPAYTAAPGAVHNPIRTVVQEFAPMDISVNGIALGWMDWMDDRLDPADPEAARAVRFTILKRPGAPEGVGALAVRLSGSGARFVTAGLRDRGSASQSGCILWPSDLGGSLLARSHAGSSRSTAA